MSVDYLDGIDVIYWINLNRAKDRKKHMENIFKDEIFKNKKIIRIKAIDYKKKNLTKYFTSSSISLTEPEYACLLSHLETIRIFSESNYENALIFEDDLSIDYKKYWTKTLKQIMDEAPKDWEILKLFSFHECNEYKNEYTEWSKSIKHGYNKYNKLRTEADWGTPSYIINKKAAKKFIHEIYHNKKYVLKDTYKGDILKHVADYLIYKMLKTYIYKYSYFSLRDNNDTYIQDFNKKKEPVKKQKEKKQTIKNLTKKREIMLEKHKNKYNKTIKNVK
jgi:GR25 family glycosyltransferase involved in LPS biosynthesis